MLAVLLEDRLDVERSIAVEEESLLNEREMLDVEFSRAEESELLEEFEDRVLCGVWVLPVEAVLPEERVEAVCTDCVEALWVLLELRVDKLCEDDEELELLLAEGVP